MKEEDFIPVINEDNQVKIEKKQLQST